MSPRFLQPLVILLLVTTINAFPPTTSLGQINGQPEQVDTTAYTIVEIPPEFPGGRQALFSFIQSASQYPLNLKKGFLVQLKLLVEQDGSISSIQVSYREAPEKFVNEAIRIIKTMPKWMPGSQDGQVRRAYAIIPIRFTRVKN